MMENKEMQGQMPKLPEYVYIFCRKDLSKEQCIVQTGHACMEAGIYFGKKTASPYYFCLLEVENECILKEVMRWLSTETNIQYRAFNEPDQFSEFTALATEPVKSDQRKLFKHFKTFKQSYKRIKKSH